MTKASQSTICWWIGRPNSFSYMLLCTSNHKKMKRERKKTPTKSSNNNSDIKISSERKIQHAYKHIKCRIVQLWAVITIILKVVISWGQCEPLKLSVAQWNTHNGARDRATIWWFLQFSLSIHSSFHSLGNITLQLQRFLILDHIFLSPSLAMLAYCYHCLKPYIVALSIETFWWIVHAHLEPN